MTENKSAPAAFVHKTTPLNNSHTHLIVPGVYLGGEVSARSKELLLNLNVGGIVNCTEEIDNHFEISRTFEYLQLDLSDEVRTRISEVWQRAFAFIEEQHAQNKAVLVHCAMGMSRSATIVLAYLMQYKQLTLKQAFYHAKSRRGIVFPNTGFRQQLSDLEFKLRGERTVNARVTWPLLTELDKEGVQGWHKAFNQSVDEQAASLELKAVLEADRKAASASAAASSSDAKSEAKGDAAAGESKTVAAGAGAAGSTAGDGAAKTTEKAGDGSSSTEAEKTAESE